MPGILDRIGKAIQSPAAQGVLAVGAAGFNPLLGLLAAPGIRNSRDRAKLENDARREELSSAKRRREATDQLAGLLGETATLERPVAGPPEPGSAGPVQQAQVPMLATGEGRQKALGLLATASPDTFGGILGEQLFPEQPKPGRLGEQVAMFREVLNRDPTEEEFKSLLGVGDDAMDPKDRLEYDKLRLEVSNLLDSRRQADEAEAQGQQSLANNINNTLESADNILELNERLANSTTPTGVAGSAMARSLGSVAGAIGDAMGLEWLGSFNDSATDFDSLKKERAVQLQNLQQSTGADSDRELEALGQRLPSVTVASGANERAAIALIKEQLQKADVSGVRVKNREHFERLIREFERKQESGALPAGLPAGSQQVGTKDGKPVYQAPDGSRYVVE